MVQELPLIGMTERQQPTGQPDLRAARIRRHVPLGEQSKRRPATASVRGANGSVA